MAVLKTKYLYHVRPQVTLQDCAGAATFESIVLSHTQKFRAFVDCCRSVVELLHVYDIPLDIENIRLLQTVLRFTHVL